MTPRKPDPYVEAILKMLLHSCDRADGRPGEAEYNRSTLRHQGRAYQALRGAVKAAIVDGGRTGAETLVAVCGAFRDVGEGSEGEGSEGEGSEGSEGSEPPTVAGQKWGEAAEGLRRFICESTEKRKGTS